MINKKVVWGLVLAAIAYSQLVFGANVDLLNIRLLFFTELITQEVIVPESLIEKSLDFISATEDQATINMWCLSLNDNMFKIEKAAPDANGQYAWYEHRVYKDFAGKCSAIYQKAKANKDNKTQAAIGMLFTHLAQVKKVSIFGDDVVTPQQLWVADDFQAEARLLDINKLNKKFNFTYCEGLICSGMPNNPAGAQAAYKNFKKQDAAEGTKAELENKISERLRNPITDRLEIRFINDTVGHGVFARENIQAGTIIGIYAGDTWPRSCKKYEVIYDGVKHYCRLMWRGGRDNDREYSYGNISAVDDNKVPTELRIVNARYFGNITRFLQHFPTIDEVPNALRGDSDLATANVEFGATLFHGFRLYYLKTKRDINKGEPLGISYGFGYWMTAKAMDNKSMRYFYKDGRMRPELFE